MTNTMNSSESSPDGGYVVAVDGPAASGKSSVSRRLAEKTGLRHINSGLMYRAATRAVLDEGISPDDAGAVARFFERVAVDCSVADDGSLVLCIGGRRRVGLQDDDVNASVSSVARVPVVREVMVAIQRNLASRVPTVMEGRDIGSVVFPGTPFKFYVDASEEVRAARRAAQGSTDSVSERDRADSTRASSPLVVPPDAIVIDSSNLGIDEVVDEIIGHLRGRGARLPCDESARRLRP